MFTFIVIAISTRRRGHVNFLPYLSNACTVAKIGNFLLFFYAKTIYGLTYSVILLGKVSAHMQEKSTQNVSQDLNSNRN